MENGEIARLDESIDRVNPGFIDRLIVLCANLFNLVMVGLFTTRVLGPVGLARVFGFISLLLALPLAFGIFRNWRSGRDRWTVILPSLLVAFLVLTFLLDYLLGVEFRTTGVLWPYILLFYASLMAMIGYAFQVKKSYGFITLATYFLALAASLWEYFSLYRA